MPFTFTLEARSGRARAGRLTTPHGEVRTPVFMPVGTAGAVKAVTREHLREVGAQIVLANTYHLMLRPGDALVRDLGGLHGFTGWSGPFLTDSGGFQVFSLTALRQLTEEGVRFQSHIDGSRHLLSPERSMEVQQNLGADIAMAFDECPPGAAPKEAVAEATARTTRWAERCRAAHTRPDQALFGIVQGGVHEDLRVQSAREIVALGFPGQRHRRGVGGGAQGRARPRPRLARSRAARGQAPLPDGRGHPRGPDRRGGARRRHVRLRDAHPERPERPALHPPRQAVAAQRPLPEGPAPPDPDCPCPTCRGTSRAYLRHLHMSGEATAMVLATIHNLFFYLDMMDRMRQHICLGRFEEFRRDALAALRGPAAEEDAS